MYSEILAALEPLERAIAEDTRRQAAIACIQVDLEIMCGVTHIELLDGFKRWRRQHLGMSHLQAWRAVQAHYDEHGLLPFLIERKQ